MENSKPDSDKQESSSAIIPHMEENNRLPAVEHSSARTVVVENMHSFSDIINNNLIAARFGAFASIFLLTVYGVTNTPLFFRYRTVSEIPSVLFLSRRRLYGRIIGKGDGNFHLSIRHLSPIGQVLPKAWFDFFMRASPLATDLSKGGRPPEESKNQLLQVKIAGIQYPPFSRYHGRSEEYLEKLAKDKTLVSLQLLARQIPNQPKVETHKRKVSAVYPELESLEERDDNTSLSAIDLEQRQVAICRLTYRPTLLQLFPTDIATSLLLDGNATISSTLVTPNLSSSAKERITDASERLDDLQRDVKYLEDLAKAEYKAVESETGMWAYPEYRKTKQEVIEEIEFQKSANIFQKLWRRITGK